jgi:hypothetical protein
MVIGLTHEAAIISGTAAQADCSHRHWNFSQWCVLGIAFPAFAVES